MDTYDDQILFEVVTLPSAVSESFTVLFIGYRIVYRSTAVEGGEKEANRQTPNEIARHVIIVRLRQWVCKWIGVAILFQSVLSFGLPEGWGF